MHIFFIAVMSLLAVALAKAETSTSLPAVLKADFVKEIAVSDARKLLGWAGDGLYWAKQDGSIEVMDKDGKSLRTLAAKEGKVTVLKQPEAVAVGDGVVYAVDSDLEQVVVFSPSGKHLYTFGSKHGGLFSSGGDELSALKSPRGIAFHEGVVYVADTDNKRIQLFGSNGVFLNALELSPGVAAKYGKEKEIYKLVEPSDIGVDYRGRVYVLDVNDGLVKIYSPNGEYLGHLPEVASAASFVMAADGMYVAERETLTVHKYDFDSKLLMQFGSKGEAKAQFKVISGLAAGNDNQFFVGDVKKSSATIFIVDAGVTHELIPKLASLPFEQWSDTIADVSADKLAWNGKDTVYGVDSDNKTLFYIHGGQRESIKLKDITPVAVAVDKTGALWVLDKKNYRVVKLDESGQVVGSFGSEGRGAGQFDKPMDLAISNSGTLFIADAGNKSVLSFSSDGVFLKALRGSAGNGLEEPVSLSFDAQDNLYVLDKSRASVAVFPPQGVQLNNFGRSESGESSGLIKPTALLALSDELLVLDGNRVKVFSRQGKYLRAFAAKGKNNGELDEPTALAAKDSATVLIADRGNKRIQTFTMQYQPPAPELLTVQEGVHTVELHWAAATQPYIKQYAVYRSKAKNGGYERIASSATNQYLDQGLEPGVKYFYRIAAETQFNSEGATSEAVSASPRKFVPTALEAVQVEATPWQLKLTWKPVDPQYFAAYLIYQKKGDVYTKIGETTTPEFSKDALTPDSNYVLFVSVRSTDATESEKLAVSGTTQTFNRPPLEIEVLKLRDIFSNTYKLYEQDGVGLIRLTNNTNKPIERIRVHFIINNFMDFPTEEKIDKLLPGQSEEIHLKAVFNNSILTVTEDTSVQTSIEASYFENSKQVVYTQSSTLTVYEKHRLIWDEEGRYAAFITPKDAPVMSFVRSVVTQYKETKDEALLAAAVFNAMGVIGMTYIPDPNNPNQIVSGKTKMVDYIQYPRETLEHNSGDCNDLVAFYTSALESLGIATRAIEVPGHMFMMFSAGVSADDDGYNMDDMYVVYEDKLWIPVETTLVGKSFVKAWETGSANYQKWKNNGLTILNIEEEWQTYKPATLPDTSWKAIDITREAIEKRYPNEFLSMLKISSQTKTRRYLQVVAKNPSDADAHLQLGIIMAKSGDAKEAMKYFDKVISLNPKNAAAMNNRGNLFIMQDRYKDAQKAYLMAAQASPNDAEIWINLTKAYKATNDTKKAKEAFNKAQSLEPSVKKRYKALALELMSAM